MKKLSYLLIFGVLVASALFVALKSASAGTIGQTVWAKTTVVNPDNAIFDGSVTDSSGNTYAVGKIKGSSTYTFGSVTVAGANASDNALIVKYNSAGTAVWAKSTTVAPNYSEFNGVAVDASGNVYAVGYIIGASQYDFASGITVTAKASSGNAVLVKYNSSGAAQWARSTAAPASAAAQSSFYGVAVDSNNDIYAVGCGYDDDPFYFGTQNADPAGAGVNNALIVKYESDGTEDWVKSTTTATGVSMFSGLDVNDSGVYAVGYINSNTIVNFDADTSATGGYASGDNAVIVKYDPATGAATWANSTAASQPNSSWFRDAVVDSSGNINAVGRVAGNSQFDFGDSIKLTGTASTENAAIVQYDASGNTLWAKSTVTGTALSSFYTADVDSSDNIYVAGKITGTNQYSFGTNATATGAYASINPLVIRYSSAGVAQWAKSTTTGVNVSDFYGIGVDSSSNIYATGYALGDQEFDFGNDISTTGVNDDATSPIVVKYSNLATTITFNNLSGDTRQINLDDYQLVTTSVNTLNVYPTATTGIQRVEFRVDSTLLCTDTTADSNGVYSCSWNASTLSGTLITVTAYDNLGESASITRHVTVSAPVLPATGQE